MAELENSGIHSQCVSCRMNLDVGIRSMLIFPFHRLWKRSQRRRNRSVSDMSLYETSQLIQSCVDRVMCLSEHSSIHVHACFQLSLSCLTSHEHRRSTLTQVPSQVSNHFCTVVFDHYVVVLKLRCRRSCCRAGKTCAWLRSCDMTTANIAEVLKLAAKPVQYDND